ncbi:L-threonylcarbamoyladenylate synthase [Curtanaerobium respiraculi]|uniref:L-threonylcarbamoyladenylate synthase n=1 Tax=Curtanaerobium respiraculi TaxID=2949669 RepID=UPI0024B33858|nr:L-threonylcarbamoyladenylate synthase [Curtanaerobium respiraculi]
MIRVSNLRIALDDECASRGGAAQAEGALIETVACHLGVPAREVKSAKVVRRSVDARRKSDVHFVVNADVELASPEGESRAIASGRATVHNVLPPLAFHAPGRPAPRPLVVGTGPAGLFCALYLAKAGLHPLLIERGAPVEDRAKAVDAFNEGAPLDPQANIQFGEGGAGTFSDGKLNTGVKHRFSPYVLQWFADAGAPREILWEAKPHIGSDLLPGVVRALREQIVELGGEVRFRTQLVDILFEGDRVSSATLLDRDGVREDIVVDRIVLATGHSARDTYEMLQRQGIALERKPFAMGVRIEHPQSLINRSQWGKSSRHPALAGRAADYKMAIHVSEKRSAFTFCMCPGGTVVAAASEAGGVVTNGMSVHARDGANANAALLVNVDPDDLPGEDPLEGVRLQRSIEQRAYRAARAAGGGAYSAPAQSVGSFLAAGGSDALLGTVCAANFSSVRDCSSAAHERASVEAQRAAKRRVPGGTSESPVDVATPTYPRGVVPCDLHAVLPGFICDTLAAALPAFDKRLHGFADPHALLTAPESRSSSPVRIVRDERLQARCLDAPAEPSGSFRGSGLYPCGEGAGYAGGIVSAAADGMRVADALVRDIQIDAAVHALAAGKPVVFPTDTVVGLGVAVDFAESPAILHRIKQRDSGKPIAWLVAGVRDLLEYGEGVLSYAVELAQAHWPGALTLVVQAGDRVPRAYSSAAGTIALRAPASKIAQELIERTGCPLATTSANMSHDRSVQTTAEVDERVRKQAAAVVDSPLGVFASGVSSSVVDCTGERPRVIRQGDVKVISQKCSS